MVLDASAVLELLLNTPRGREVADRIRDPALVLCAPHLLDVEVLHVLRRMVANGSMPEPRARQALADLHQLGLDCWGHDALLPRLWQLRDNLTAYDAAYVSLAEALGAPLLTCDARLASAPASRARIELVR